MKLWESPADLHQRADELVSRRYTLWWALGVLAAEEGKPRDCTWIGQPYRMDEWKRGYDEMREAIERGSSMPSKPPSEMTREELRKLAHSAIATRTADIEKRDAAYDAVSEFASRLAATEEKAESLEMEAQIHAQEARTQKATVHTIYRAIRKGKGEPGDWHGAQPIVDYIAELEQKLATTEVERDAAREDSTWLAAKIRNVVPYVVATLPIGSAEEWGRVHTGRAQSSLRQLQSLLDAARHADDEGEEKS